MADQRQARPDRPAAGPLVHVRLQEEIERLKHEPAVAHELEALAENACLLTLTA